jgi:hypothetical protein
MIDDLKIKEEKYIKDNMDNINFFLTEDLGFVLVTKNDNKIYKFVKNREEYTIEISSYFISYYKAKAKITYAYSVNYKNDNWNFQSLKEYEFSGVGSSYSKDVHQYLKEYDNSKKVLEKNLEMYNEVKELSIDDLFEYNIKKSNASISRYDKDVKKYNNLIDFIKEILSI